MTPANAPSYDHPVVRAFSFASRAALWAAGIGLVAMTAMVAWQVWCRYVLNDSPSWTEPGAVMLMSWFIFLGAAVGVRENNHLGFDILLYIVPLAGKRALRTISDIVILAFGIGMIWYGWQLVELTSTAILPSLGISGSYDYYPVVAGGVLVVLFTLERMALRLAGAPVDAGLEIPTPEAETELDAARSLQQENA
ncbi:MAG: TRAP transporter small permease [Rhizobiaceae bacterium]|nr:TRAP transporter small permease [Rhizobiaceae bacterium]MCV0405165.1 TRAP transporter small permease [Rhizobiaceae bacterium]